MKSIRIIIGIMLLTNLAHGAAIIETEKVDLGSTNIFIDSAAKIINERQHKLDQQLFDATLESNYSKISELIKQGAKANSMHLDKLSRIIYCTALHIAVNKGDVKLVRILLEDNPYKSEVINQLDTAEETPLIVAIHMSLQTKITRTDKINKYFEIIKYLIANGANIGPDEFLHQTPLFVALSYMLIVENCADNFEVQMQLIKLLLDSGVNVQTKTNNQEDAFSIAHKLFNERPELDSDSNKKRMLDLLNQYKRIEPTKKEFTEDDLFPSKAISHPASSNFNTLVTLTNSNRKRNFILDSSWIETPSETMSPSKFRSSYTPDAFRSLKLDTYLARFVKEKDPILREIRFNSFIGEFNRSKSREFAQIRTNRNKNKGVKSGKRMVGVSRATLVDLTAFSSSSMTHKLLELTPADLPVTDITRAQTVQEVVTNTERPELQLSSTIQSGTRAMPQSLAGDADTTSNANSIAQNTPQNLTAIQTEYTATKPVTPNTLANTNIKQDNNKINITQANKSSYFVSKLIAGSFLSVLLFKLYEKIQDKYKTNNQNEKNIATEKNNQKNKKQNA